MLKLRCKVAVCGDSMVGKTSLIKQFLERNLPIQYLMTLGCNITTKNVPVPIVQHAESSAQLFPNSTHTPSEESSSMAAASAAQDKPEAEVELHITDISGHKIYEKFVADYVENISAFIVVYDVTNLESFNNATKWIELCRNTRKSSTSVGFKAVPGVLVANKNDCERVKVKYEQGEALAKKYKIPFFKLTAVRGEQNYNLNLQIANF